MLVHPSSKLSIEKGLLIQGRILFGLSVSESLNLENIWKSIESLEPSYHRNILAAFFHNNSQVESKARMERSADLTKY